MMKHKIVAAVSVLIILQSLSPVWAQDNVELEAIREEVAVLKQSYEARIAELESRLAQVEYESAQVASAPVTARSVTTGNEFNPAIGLILNGKYASFSNDESEFAGFGPGEEGERGSAGLGIGESELTLASNIDDKFYGSLTAAIAHEEGEDIIELEEAYIRTLPGAGLPLGATLKAGRALWTFGYQNEHHAHRDDFADRALPYRVFLNQAYNDDGVEFSYVLPTLLYTEIGGGLFRGDDFPFGGSDADGVEAWSVYGRVGGDIGFNQSWRAGGYMLSGEAKGGRESNEGAVTFVGDVDLYAMDLRYTWAPTGNPSQKEFTFQGEYFQRNEDGTYEDADASTGVVPIDEVASGWYLQGVYKFHPQWRVGMRYSQLNSPDVPVGLIGSALDSDGSDPSAYALMADWSNTEFSRVRFQFNREELMRGEQDNQFILQYIMSLGAHGSHSY